VHRDYLKKFRTPSFEKNKKIIKKSQKKNHTINYEKHNVKNQNLKKNFLKFMRE